MVGAPLIVASGEKYPDALAAAALVSASGGRLVLTRRDALPADVVNSAWATPDGWASGGLGYFSFADHYVIHRAWRTVYIVGGTGAVGKPVEDWFANKEAHIVRLAGADRYGTAAAVADEVVALTGTTTVNPVVVSGETFADALGGAALSAARKQPLLLVGPDYVPACVTAFYAAHAATDSVVLGGSAVMSDSVVAQLKPAVRIAGADRYDTCAQSVTYGLDQGWFKPYHVAIVTGANFPDGLGAGAALGRLGWPTLLTYRDTLPTATADVLADNDVVRVSVLGGTGVVSAEVATTAKALLK
ncbi:MAG: cell wall-binding repeat-containing protein [Actinobacteria bacterium]|nr:MAG: cell wall-binding repeat-containing protein [Actinomycetota bacterium]